MTKHDYEYLNTLSEIQCLGRQKGDRTGTGTLSRFGMQMRFDLTQGFPLLTTKFVHYKSVVWELLWLMGGHTNIKWLNERGVNIWNEWADENGELGPVYGEQWRSWPTENGPIDQLRQCVETLKTNPDDRRIIVSAWNVGQLQGMALPPCHLLFQFWACDGELSCQVYQRSCDMFLGVPFNIASYATLTHIIARCVGMTPGDLIWTGGDCHIYNNHFNQVNTQMSRDPFDSPTLMIRSDAPYDIDGEWGFEHFCLTDYEHHARIKAEVSV